MEGSSRESIVGPELYFLISKFLALSPLEETKRVLVQELERHKILPKRIDWLGQEHDQSFEELERKYPHIGPKHLLEICGRIGPILDRELKPSVANLPSLLGAGRQSLLRSKDSIMSHRGLVDFCTRLNGMPLPESIARRKENNLSRVLFGREHGGPIVRRLAVSSCLYEKLSLLRRTLGHLSAVYCVLFERSGKYILTGADDFLVKLWSATDGRLLATFRGASSEITDIAVNIDNTLMAAGSLDRILRVWDLQTTAPIAVLTSHTGMITSVNFCPSPRGDLKYLVTTSTDGSVAFWQYAVQRGKTQFNSKPIQYHEKLRPGQAQMICAAFSPGGIFLAAGSADHFVRVYLMGNDGPKRILETEAHTDTVDSIQWAHSGLRFISGGKDGTAHIWNFESQQWRSMKLNMTARLPGSGTNEDDGKKLKVTMVSWDASDNYVMTAVNDFTIKVWNSKTGQLHKVLRGHTDELYVLESHPKDQHVLLSAGHDGQIFLWDIYTGRTINSFVNYIEGQGNGGVFDAKWSPDGTMIGATDSHGHILMFGFGSGHERMKKLPTELFFHTDYRPVIRDGDHHVLDEQTQMMPHLMPPPFLVDVDGNPHPPALQRLVPGRESCPTDQLIPNIAPGNEGVMEVQSENTVSDLDLLIEALAQRQQGNSRQNNNNNGAGAGNNNNNNDNNQQQPLQPQQLNRVGNMNSPRGSQNRVGLRRSGDVEGVRQSSGNWHRGDASFKFQSRCYVKPIRHARLQMLKYSVYCIGHQEMETYKKEMRRRPVMINTTNNNQLMSSPGQNGGAALGRTRNRARLQVQPPPSNSNYRTRSIRVMEPIQSEEEDEEENVESNSSGSSSDMSEEMAALDGSSSSDSDSSEYSDWVADQEGPNLEPPKRSNRTRVERRAFSPSGHPALPGPSNRRQGVANGLGGPSTRGDAPAEIPAELRPSEWLTEVVPRKAPYYPQMGDEVVYMRQGHQRYLEAVRSKNAYTLTDYTEPWQKLTLRDHEFVKVIGIKYELRPPRLCCLKLALMDLDGNLTGRTFTIKYHDMPDVLDFLVLRQTYDLAVSRRWQPGDRFRCMIDDGWWMGAIETRTALSNDFPQSLFMCFHVRWDNGEFEYMSPWDMEPVDENRLPTEEGGAVPVLPDELQALLYQPKLEEWLDGDRETACRRICSGLEQVMGMAFAEPFLAPVDLNLYPSYAYVIEYPIDLTTIKMRFENHFYRRITSAQFDVRYLARNAEKYNEVHSEIVRHARVLVELCLRVMREPEGIDVTEAAHDLYDNYRSSDSEQGQPSSSGAAGTGRSGPRSGGGARRSQRLGAPMDWNRECRELLDMLWQCDDSSPFREPVDVIEHPDYHQIIDTPMDLLTIKEDLLGGNYSTPGDFAKDVRMIFQNSKNYNTNKRSRIYSMTLRLSTLFETHIRPILTDWNKPKRSKSRRGGRGVGPEPSPGPSTMANPRSSSTRGGTGDPSEPGPSNSRPKRTTASNGRRRALSTSDEDDDRDDRTHRQPVPSTSTSSSRNGTRGVAGISSASQGNGVSSSSMAGPSSSSYHSSRLEARYGPVPSSSARPQRISRVAENGQSNGNGREGARSLRRRTDVADEQQSHNTEDSSASSTASSDSDGSNGIPLSELGHARRANRQYDSEDSYRPTGTSSRKTSSRKKKKKSSGGGKSKRQSSSQGAQPSSQSRRTRRVALVSSEEESRVAQNASESEHSEEDNEVLQRRKRSRPSRSSPAEPVAATSSRRENLRRGPNTTSTRNGRTRDSESEDLSSDDPLSRKPRRKKSRYESDQSFQLEAPRTTRRPRIVGSESAEEEEGRPTRSSKRKANAAWARSEDEEEVEEEKEEVEEEDEEEEDDDNENQEIEAEEPRSSRRAAVSTMEPSSSQRRSNRTRRTRIHDSENEEEEEEEERHPRRTQNTRIRTETTSSYGRFRTRRRAMFDEEELEEEDGDAEENEREQDDEGSQDSEEEADSDINRRQRHRSRGSAAARNNLLNNNSRNSLRTRSGRNNHENGQSRGEPVDDPLAEHSRRITAAPEARINFVPVPGGSRTSRRLMNEVTSSSNLNSGAVRILAPSHEMDHNYLQPDRTRNTRRTLSRHQRNADELDPLQCPPSTSELIHPLVGTSSRLRSSTANETIIQRRTYISTSATSTEGSEIVNGGSSRRIGRLVTEPGPSSSQGTDGSNQRTSGRKVRRMDYNEDSEAEGETSRGRAARVTRRLALNPEEGEARTVTRSTEYEDDEEEDNDEDGEEEEEEGEPTVSVSSRGRVRRIIAKARRLFRE